MTKQEMLDRYYPYTIENNYKYAQEYIKERMMKGYKFIEFNEFLLPETISHLRKDGFIITIRGESRITVSWRV